MTSEVIRLATEEDAARMLEIYRPNVLNTAISFETEVPSLQDFKNRITETTAKFPWIVCEQDKKIVGYAYAGPYRSRCAYGWSVESTVYVDADFQGRGIGAKLYKLLLALLKSQGAVNVIAGITQPNIASVRLHESLGFEHVGIFKDIGFKLDQWWGVGYWQLSLQKPPVPGALLPPLADLEIKQ